MTRAIRALDVVIIGLVLAAAVFSGLSIYGNRSGKARLVIESPEGRWLYGLDIDRTVEIPGQLGVTVVEIREGMARIVDSPCPNKTCVAAPPISRVGDWSACLPNQVMLRVEAIGGSDREDDGIDAVVR
jgi:hypothetical protein